jgi:hypothetical protein
MEIELDAKAYRDIANFLEQELEELTSYAENLESLFVPVVGGLQYFSRPAPEISALGQQLGLLQDQASEAIEIFKTLAFTAETKDKFPMHPLLIKQLQAQVFLYIDYYNTRKNQPTKDIDDKESEPNIDDKESEPNIDDKESEPNIEN